MLPAVFRALRAGGLPACGFRPGAAYVGTKLQPASIHVYKAAQQVAFSSTAKQGTQLSASNETVSQTQIKVGDVVRGTVRDVQRHGVLINLDTAMNATMPAFLHIKNVSHDLTKYGELSKLFRKGQTIKAVVLETSNSHQEVELGVKQLEPAPGDKQLVSDKAE